MRPAHPSTIALPIDTGQPGAGLFDAARDHIRVVLRDVHVEVSIGLHPWEKLRPQRLVVNVELWAYAPPRYTPDDASLIVDYDRLRDVIRNEWPTRGHVPLLEPLAEELLDVCFANATVMAARVRIEKPDIFSEARGVGIELYRRNPAQERAG